MKYCDLEPEYPDCRSLLSGTGLREGAWVGEPQGELYRLYGRRDGGWHDHRHVIFECHDPAFAGAEPETVVELFAGNKSGG